MMTRRLLLLVTACAFVDSSAQVSQFNDHWVQPEAYTVPGFQTATGVGAQGDLSLSVPLLTVPGRGGLDYSVALSYASPIKVDQSATWVGLGWQFNPGTVTRDPQGAVAWNSGNQFNNVDFTAIPSYFPDAFFAALPGRGTVEFTRVTTGGASVPNYPTSAVHGGVQVGGTWDRAFVSSDYRPWVIQARKADPVYSGTGPGDYIDNGNWRIRSFRRYPSQNVLEDMEDFDLFVVTVEDGTRYVFSGGLRWRRSQDWWATRRSPRAWSTTSARGVS